MRRTFDRPLLSGEAEFRLDSQYVSSDIGEFIPSASPATLDALYQGRFLDGFYLKDAPEFERWASRECERTTAIACHAMETIARNAAATGDHGLAVETWRRRSAMSPLDSGPAMELMNALASSGDRAAAVRYARQYDALLRVEDDMDPNPLVHELAERIQREVHSSARVDSVRPASIPAQPAKAPDVTTLPVSSVRPPSRPVRRVRAAVSARPQPTLGGSSGRRWENLIAGVAGAAFIAVVMGFWPRLPKR